MSSTSLGALLLALLGTAWLAAPAHAHPSAWSTVLIDESGGRVSLSAQIPIDEYEAATGTEIDRSDAGVAAVAASVASYVGERVSLTVGDDPVPLSVVDVGLGELADQDAHASIDVALTGTMASAELTSFELTWGAVVHDVPSHKVYVSLAGEGENQLLDVVTDADPTIEVGDRPADISFSHMVRVGVDHIATGYDHLLFLLMLLLPAPALARRGRTGGRAVGAALGRVALVATAFTVGHSLSLALVSFGLVSFPARPVETLVAASILVAAVHAVRPLVNRGEVWIAGGFGLVHGTAFATTVLELHLSTADTARAVLAFNVGIELAQLVAIVAVVPLLVLAAASSDYRYLVGTVAVLGALAALDWIVAIWRVSTPVLDPVYQAIGAQPLLAWGGLALVTGAMWLARGAAGRNQEADSSEVRDSRVNV
ncbi:HupE/UreJ family protein [Nocardioides sp.]|uniref:HupE/UreJ family protein n=1 Tax=Nocardioides sp. TaxID=35761 RepID=UPI0039E3B0A2